MTMLEKLEGGKYPEELALGSHNEGYWVENVDAQNAELSRWLQNVPAWNQEGDGILYGALLGDRVVIVSKNNLRRCDPRGIMDLVTHRRDEHAPTQLQIEGPIIDGRREYERCRISIQGQDRDSVRKLVAHVLMARPPLDAELTVSLILRIDSHGEERRPLYAGKVSEVVVRAAVDAVMGDRHGYSNR